MSRAGISEDGPLKYANYDVVGVAEIDEGCGLAWLYIIRYADAPRNVPGSAPSTPVRIPPCPANKKKRDLLKVGLFSLAGMEGFEPPNAGTRTQCLTTWRHPNRTAISTGMIDLQRPL